MSDDDLKTPTTVGPREDEQEDILAKAEALDKEDVLPDESFQDALLRMVSEALEESDMTRACALLLDQHYADAADVLERMDPDERSHLVLALGKNFDPDILPALDEDVQEQVLSVLGVSDLAALVGAMESDDAVAVVEQLDEDERRQVIQALTAEDRANIELAFTYPDDSAGRMMQRELIAVPEFWTVGDTLNYLRTTDDVLPETFYEVFMVDLMHHPVGRVSSGQLLRSMLDVPLKEIMEEDLHPIPAMMDQEEVALNFRDKDWVTAIVVDEEGRLLGRITVDDIVDVIDEEAEEDMMRLGGVTESDIFDAAWGTIRSRFTWLFINLGTAMLAASVIGLFEDTIEQVVALAVLMPVVAGMGGNAGTQTLTVTVRALAMKELTMSNARRVIGKEIMVGLANGLCFAVLAGLVSYLWFKSWNIGIVLALAMVINLAIAALAGILIPLTLDRLRVDPAISSGVFLTTVTDITGFFAFLGLATLFLL